MPIQSSACTLASRVSGKFSCLIQALEMRRDLVLRDIKVAETQALAQAQEEEQRLQGHLEAVTRFDRRIQGLLEQLDDRTFLQVAGQRVAGWGTHTPARCTLADCSCPLDSGITAPGATRASGATDSSRVGCR